MGVRMWQVDAFAERAFAGNSAAVCFLEEERSAEWMQLVGMEMNLSETAFVRRLGERAENRFELRWFTPEVEVDLCGHATLAAAHALWEGGIASTSGQIAFETKSGTLRCGSSGGKIEMDFPAVGVTECAAPGDLLESLGVEGEFVGRTKFDHVVVVKSEEMVRGARPDFARLGGVATRGVMLTARSSDARFDFVSRFFAPGVGINEDPVTGSAHCTLGPYWGDQLNKERLRGYQASRRGGVVEVELRGERVGLRGSAVTVVRGEVI